MVWKNENFDTYDTKFPHDKEAFGPLKIPNFNFKHSCAEICLISFKILTNFHLNYFLIDYETSNTKRG